ncbi:MAG: DUF2119 domain-containing protein [Methanophagales archaeon ANME-1-THS]|nr:MAG: DUF2119 domain-containing protein [Methanophagales archaeon ANME-1-THS]
MFKEKMGFEEQHESGVKLYRLVAGETRPAKLFVGGVHGTEGLYTAPILEHLAREEVYQGEVIIIPSLVETSEYIGVLSEEYYQSDAGMKLLQLILRYKPRFYFELHAYEEPAYARLTDPERVKKIGVPHFVDLYKGVLIGSIAPILRRKFTANDFCMTIEVPKWKCAHPEIIEKVLEVLRIALTKTDREEVMHELRTRYPEQIKMAVYLFHQYYREHLKPF